MNVWGNAWLSKQESDWMNGWEIDLVSEQLSEGMIKWVSESVGDYVSDDQMWVADISLSKILWVIGWANVQQKIWMKIVWLCNRVICVNKKISKRVTEYVREVKELAWLIDWLIDWLTDEVSEAS